MGTQGAVPDHTQELCTALTDCWHMDELCVRRRHADAERSFGDGTSGIDSAPAYRVGA